MGRALSQPVASYMTMLLYSITIDTVRRTLWGGSVMHDSNQQSQWEWTYRYRCPFLRSVISHFIYREIIFTQRCSHTRLVQMQVRWEVSLQS